MKSRTSCYDCATGRMELRRFAPLWVLYAIGLFLITSMAITRYGNTLDNRLYNIRDLSKLLALYNFGYAFVLAQILFGDLYIPRLCYAIHALPIPKGGWFGTQIILGIMGTLVPNLINAGLITCIIPEFPVVALWSLMASMLGFLCFFGIAALCAICSGNRLGLLILYGLINLFDGLLAWFRMKLYAGLIYGLYIKDADAPLSPIYRMVTNFTFELEHTPVLMHPDDPMRSYWDQQVSGVAANSGILWEYAIWAVVGCAAIWLAMRLYRRRKLECTGDLLAFSKMELPVLVLVTIASAGVGHVCAYAFNWQLNYLLLFLGMILGYYACQMLLKRRVNVFRLRTLAPLLVICGIFVLSLLLTGLDLFGITYRMPKVEDVASISIHMSESPRPRTVTDPENIQMVLNSQEDALNDHRRIESSRPLLERLFGDESGQLANYDLYGNREGRYLSLLYILYTMKDGSQLNRCYIYPNDSETLPQLSTIFSDPEVVMHDYERSLFDENGTLDSFLNSTGLIQLNCSHGAETDMNRRPVEIDCKDAQGLMDAILADCAAGHMAQSRFLHPGVHRVDYVCFSYQWPDDRYPSSFGFDIYPECENTYQWLITNGYHGEDHADTPYSFD